MEPNFAFYSQFPARSTCGFEEPLDLWPQIEFDYNANSESYPSSSDVIDVFSGATPATEEHAIDWETVLGKGELQEGLSTEIECTKSQLIKERVRLVIERKSDSRKERGHHPKIDPIKRGSKMAPEEGLSRADEEKLEKRRSSNRKAAEKCRKKKKTHNEGLEQGFVSLELINEALRRELLELRQEEANLTEMLVAHSKICPLSQATAEAPPPEPTPGPSDPRPPSDHLQPHLQLSFANIQSVDDFLNLFTSFP